MRNTTTENKPARLALNCAFAITRCNWSQDNAVCRFSIDLDNGITLHGMTLRYKEGVPMLLPPSFKTKEGKWLSHYYVNFSSAMGAEIVKTLEGM